jgi:DNA invertase Pin-like site-specific DNA recombinase
LKPSSDVAELLFWLMQSSSENDIFGAIAEFERDLIRERTNAGLEAARARGKKGGRKRVLTDKQISIGKSLAADSTRSVEDICETLKISPATYYRYIHHQV